MSENRLNILRTKCILFKPSPTDGIRISVMSRHTLNDGLTPDPRLFGTFDKHYPKLGPSPNLIGDYYRGLSWEKFAERYLDGLTGIPQREAMASVFEHLCTTNATLMCIERTPDKCHRRLLAQTLQKLNYGLVVDIR